MINDPVELAIQRNAWAAVRDTQERFKDTLGFTFFAAGGLVGHGIFDACHDLTLIFAYAVLEDVLGQLQDEGRFSVSRRGLEALMVGSRSALPWQDFPLVDRGRGRRNDFAHRRMVVPVSECIQYLDAVEQELRAWKIVT